MDVPDPFAWNAWFDVPEAFFLGYQCGVFTAFLLVLLVLAMLWALSRRRAGRGRPS